MLLLSRGTDTLFPAADVSAEGGGLADALPNAEHVAIAPARHVSCLLRCKPEGAAILRDEEDDPVCDEPGGGDRAAVHRAVPREALAVLNP